MQATGRGRAGRNPRLASRALDRRLGQLADRTELNIGFGDAVVIELGHDAWAVGEAQASFLGTDVAAYGKPA